MWPQSSVLGDCGSLLVLIFTQRSVEGGVVGRKVLPEAPSEGDRAQASANLCQPPGGPEDILC